MFDAIKSNPRTSIWGIAALIAYTLQQQPGLVSFLPDEIEGYVLGGAAFICAVKAILAAQDKLTPEQQEVKNLNKEKDKEIFKKEIKEEVRVLAKDKAAELLQSTPPKAVVIPEITAETLTVGEIKTDSLDGKYIIDAKE